MESILTHILGYVANFFIVLLVINALFVVLAVLLSWLAHRLGWSRVQDNGPRWWRILFITVVVITGFLVGIGAGTYVAGFGTSVKAVNELGTELIKPAVETGVERLGIQNLQKKLPLEEIWSVLNSIKEAKLEYPGFWGSLLSDMLDRIRDRFVDAALPFVEGLAPEHQISINELVDRAWGQFETNLQRRARVAYITAIGGGSICLIALWSGILFCCWIIRRVRRPARLQGDSPPTNPELL